MTDKKSYMITAEGKGSEALKEAFARHSVTGYQIFENISYAIADLTKEQAAALRDEGFYADDKIMDTTSDEVHPNPRDVRDVDLGPS
jgi:hypothetical protein